MLLCLLWGWKMDLEQRRCWERLEQRKETHRDKPSFLPDGAAPRGRRAQEEASVFLRIGI